MDATIGLAALILAVVGAWTIARAIGRGLQRVARAAQTAISNAANTVLGKVRSALRAAARVRDHRQHGHERLQGEAIAMLVNMIAELRAEMAELKSGAAPAGAHSPEVIDLLTTRRFRT